jgi:hypothetical protein
VSTSHRVPFGESFVSNVLAVDESCYVLGLTFSKVLPNRLITRHPYLEISSNQDSASRLMIGFVRGPCVKLEASFQSVNLKSSAGVPERLQKTGGQISHIQPPASILLQAPASLHHGVNFHESEERIVTEIILVSSSRDSSLSRGPRIGSVPQNMTQRLKFAI